MEKLHSQCRYTTTARSRRQKAPDGNLSEDSCYPSSDSSESSDGGVLLRPSASYTAQNMNEITHKSDTSDDVVIPSRQFILLRSASDHTNSQNSALPWPNRGTTPIAQLGGLFNNSIGSDPPSTSEGALEISSVISGSRPSSPDHNTSFRPIKLNGSPSFRASQALTSSVPPSINGLGGGIVPIAVHGPEQREHTHHTNTTRTSSNQTSPPRQRYFAYVEDADSDDTEPRTDSLNSFAVNTGVVRDQDHRTAPGEFSLEAEQSSASYDQGLSRSPSRVANSLSSDYPPSTYSLDGSGSEVYDDEHDMGEKQSRSISPSLRTPPSSSHQSSLSKDTNRIKIGQRPSKVYPRRILRPRRTDTPDLPLPNDPDYRSFAPTAPSSADGLSPRTYYPYGPQSGLGVPPYAPSVPAPNHEPHFAPSSPYGQYPGPDIPPGYPNYVQYQQGNPYSIPPNPDYFQPPPPLLTNIQGSPTRLYPLDPRAGKLTSQQEPENVFNSASAVNITPLYKPPVSSDPSEHDISFQIPLKKSVKLNIPCRGEMAGYWETDSSPNGPGGNSCLTRIRSLEYYADRSGQGKITILRPQLADTSALGGMGVLRWLHLQQSTLCLNDLRDLIHNCQGLDEDLKTLTDGFLKDECAKFEKKYSSGSRHGYYIEPGTVLRCDARYDHEPNKVGKSVFFCSVPYLQLGRQDQPKSPREEFDMHVHPARTLMESLYDYDLLDDRDSRQAILQRAPPEQDSILYIPQIWYILCGSDILISYSQLSFDDICKDSIQTRDESSRSLIANVTDLDNHQFSVALKTTDSFFSAIERIESLRSNAGSNTIHDYDLVLDNNEHLIPKNWLDIVDRDRLPSLKITLKFRSKKDKNSLALIVREREFQFAKKHTADSSASDNDDNPQTSLERRELATRTSNSGQRDHPDPQSLSTQRNHSAPTYTLTSYKGSMNDTETGANDLPRSDDDVQYSEHFDESYAPTLVGSLESRQNNDRRRIRDLESRGIVLNDIFSVSNEPEVFSLETNAPETDPKPIVWDYLVDKWGVERHSLDDCSDTERERSNQDDATPTAAPSFAAIAGESKSQAIENEVITESPDVGESHQAPKQSAYHYQGQRLKIPFLQWDSSKTGKDDIKSDIIVGRVLDRVHDRLLKSSEHFKRYARSHTSSLETLQNLESPLHAAIDNQQLDKILSFRRKIAQERKNQLFQASKKLIKKFIPLDFAHEATLKIWGAVYRICETLESIFKAGTGDLGDSYLVQDYTGDSDLTSLLGLTRPKVSMEGCTRCSSVFIRLEDGIAHLKSVHFDPDSNTASESANENQRIWLRTPHQLQLEARIHTFLTLIEECVEAFQKLNKTAKDLQLGSLKVRDAEDVKGYPVFESLVRVFEHITIILVFACDFMVKAEKDMRKDCRKALNGRKFRDHLKRSLHQIVSSAQKDLEQAKIDMILASRTERGPGVASLASIGPEFIIAVISNRLFFRKLRDISDNSDPPDNDTDAHNIGKKDVDVGEVYRMYANKLQLQVNQKPQKRLLPDIYALEEELDILLRLNHWQRKFCDDFSRVLDPASYRITTKSRLSFFGTEKHYLLKTMRRLQFRSSELHSLQKRTEKLRDQLQQSIEIEEESHGKAIRVFTFVTIFFLPLSFVTSFFGMNTVDIRNTDQDQRLFWIVSVPTTAFVIGIAYLYGYKWEDWKEGSRPRRKRLVNRATDRGARILQSINLRRPFRDTVNEDDLEKGPKRQGTGFSQLSMESVKGKVQRGVHPWRR